MGFTAAADERSEVAASDRRERTMGFTAAADERSEVAA